MGFFCTCVKVVFITQFAVLRRVNDGIVSIFRIGSIAIEHWLLIVALLA